MRFIRRLLVAGVVAGLLTACASPAQDAADSPASDPEPAASQRSTPTATGAGGDSSVTAGTQHGAGVETSGGSASSTAGPQDTLPVAPPADDLTEVTYGSVGGMTDAPVWIADALGLFAQQGISISYNKFSAGVDIVPAMLTDSLDVGAIAVSAGLFNAINEGAGFKFVGDRQSLQGPHRYGLGFLVASSLAGDVDPSDTAAIAEMMKGKRVAITAKNTSTHYILDKLLASWGLAEGDVDIVPLSYPSIVTAFHTGAIDAAIVLEPFRQNLLADGIAVQLSHFDGVIPTGTTVPLTYSESFVGNKDLGNGFMLAYVRGAQLMQDALDSDSGPYRDQVIDIIAAKSDLSPEDIGRADPPGIKFDGPVDLSYMEGFQDFMIDLGVMKQGADLASAVDDSFGDYARQELGIG